MKNYGFIKDTIKDERDYIFGSSPLPREVLCPGKDWFDYLPAYEAQAGVGWDPHNCTVHAIQNALEILYKRKYGQAPNFSERYNTILAKIRPPGGTPKQAAESIRKYGMIGDSLLPMTTTHEEYMSPDPMSEIFLSLGENFLSEHDIGYEYLWENEPSHEEKYDLIDEALKYSSIPLSITAWHEGPEGDYRDLGQPNNHFCVAFSSVTVGGIKRLKVFDTYDHSIKVLDPKHHIEVAMRLYLDDPYWKQVNKRDNWVVQLIQSIGAFIKDIMKPYAKHS